MTQGMWTPAAEIEVGDYLGYSLETYTVRANGVEKEMGPVEGLLTRKSDGDRIKLWKKVTARRVTRTGARTYFEDGTDYRINNRHKVWLRKGET